MHVSQRCQYLFSQTIISLVLLLVPIASLQLIRHKAGGLTTAGLKTVSSHRPRKFTFFRERSALHLLPHALSSYAVAFATWDISRNNIVRSLPILFSTAGNLRESMTNGKEELIFERNQLQYELHLIEALELRNEAQLMSFVDEKAQWNSLTIEEQTLLLRRPTIENRIDEIDTALIDSDPTGSYDTYGSWP